MLGNAPPPPPVCPRSYVWRLYLSLPHPCRTLQEHQVVEDVFVARPHVQLMKRSVDLLRFLAREGRLQPSLFDAVWACSRSSFRDQAVAVGSL